MPEPGSPYTVTRLRMEEAEDLMASGVTPKRARSILAKRWSCSSRQAARVVRRVQDQWEIESRVDRETKRNLIRQRLGMMWRRAMTKKGVFELREVVDGMQVSRLEKYDDPDISAAAKSIALEMQLDGLNAPEKHEHSLSVPGALLPALAAHYGMDQLPAEVIEMRDATGDGRALDVVDAEHEPDGDER